MRTRGIDPETRKLAAHPELLSVVAHNLAQQCVHEANNQLDMGNRPAAAQMLALAEQFVQVRDKNRPRRTRSR